MSFVFDSCFCVLYALIALKRHGVFAGALKKHQYWLAHCRGNAIDRHFDEMEVGSMDAVKGKLDEEDYNMFCMKGARLCLQDLWDSRIDDSIG